jgi:hypothetical protein
MLAERTDYDRSCAVLSIGLAGCHGVNVPTMLGDSVCHSTTSYYDTRLRAYYGELIEGGYVIVKTAPLESKPGLAALSPFCKASLPPGTRKAFQCEPDNFIANLFANQPDNGYCGIARLMLAAPECGAFDDVAPDVYAAWWASKGAKVGQRAGNEIVWADGTREAIPAFADRYQD